MIFNFFKRKNILKKTNYLELTPFRKQKFETTTEGRVLILIPKFKNNRLKQLLLPKNKSNDFAVKLDDLGSKVWMKLDGKKKVGVICEELENEATMPLDQIELRVTKFLTQLYKSGYVDFNELNK